MTPDARMALRQALGQVKGHPSFLQERTANTSTTTGFPEHVGIVIQPVQEGPRPLGQWKKCVDGTPNCGLLHDLMSLEWGKFRDSFDELAADMKTRKQAYELEKQNINEQLTVINNEKTKHMEVLANTISNVNADTEEMNEKDEQKRELTHEFLKECAIFRAKITEIMYTRICAVRKVRNEILITSQKTPPENI